MKVSQKAKFSRSIFQLKMKRKQIFQVRRQFQHFEYDMNQTLILIVIILGRGGGDPPRPRGGRGCLQKGKTRRRNPFRTHAGTVCF